MNQEEGMVVGGRFGKGTSYALREYCIDQGDG